VFAAEEQLVVAPAQSRSFKQGSPSPMNGHVRQLLVRQCWRLIQSDAPRGNCCAQLHGCVPQLSSHIEKLTHALLAWHAVHSVPHPLGSACLSHKTQLGSGAIDMPPPAPLLPDGMPLDVAPDDPVPDDVPADEVPDVLPVDVLPDDVLPDDALPEALPDPLAEPTV
jgi:hypothetical protein